MHFLLVFVVTDVTYLDEKIEEKIDGDKSPIGFEWQYLIDYGIDYGLYQ